MNTAPEGHEKPFLERMTALYTDLDSMWTRHGDMPDEVCDAIVDAAGLLCEAIINHPVETEKDIACKLRFAAGLIDSKDGAYWCEMSAVERALSDLIEFRSVKHRTETQKFEHSAMSLTPH